MIVPVLGSESRVIGTIDVESGRVNALTERDRALLEACAAALRPLWSERARTS